MPPGRNPRPGARIPNIFIVIGYFKLIIHEQVNEKTVFIVQLPKFLNLLYNVLAYVIHIFIIYYHDCIHSYY